MDFNGYGSDCVKGPKTFFVGSDCQKAMLQGHCWNEIMNKNESLGFPYNMERRHAICNGSSYSIYPFVY